GRREASSGTTPPYGAWSASCEATTLDRIRRPSVRTAAAVSSHELSIPSTIIPGVSPVHTRSRTCLAQATHGSRRPRGLRYKCQGRRGPSPLPRPASPSRRSGRRLLRPDLALRILRRALLLDDSHGLDIVDGPLYMAVLLRVC